MIRGKIHAAAYLARRLDQGHKVALVEAQPRLGGAVSIARAAPALHTLGDITYWLEQGVFRLGVDVRLGTYLEAAEVRAENPDVLIVATGSMPRMDGIQVAAPCHAPSGVNLPHVLSSRDLIEGAELSGASTALVLDSLPATSSLRSGKGILRRVICRSTRCGGGKASPSYGLEIIG